jgi:hypothetical protein
MRRPYMCACGERFANAKELRVHIALLTTRWPAQRCSIEHYSPGNEADEDYIEQIRSAIISYGGY